MPVELYTKENPLTVSEGFERFLAEKNAGLNARAKKLLALAEIKPDSFILDVGCGSGELTLHSGARGAFALGVDISREAVELSRNSLRAWSALEPALDNKVYFVEADCMQLEFRPRTFDVIFLSDVIEHLDKMNFDILISRLSKFIKLDGKIVLHTSPAKILKNDGLKNYNIVAKLSKLKYTKEFHINDRTVLTLKKLFSDNGFSSVNLWLEKNPRYIRQLFKDDKYPGRLNNLYNIFPVKHLFFSDIYGVVGK
jgi:cyclopropane fatty-acyl-phospholipid synthase-like methyltransferase